MFHHRIMKNISLSQNLRIGLLVCLGFLTSPVLINAQSKSLDDSQARYQKARKWMNENRENYSRQEFMPAYRAHLISEGYSEAQADAAIKELWSNARRQEVEMWNRVLTADEPRFNTNPNEFLVRMEKMMTPGRSLDVGMGQGRNAIFLAQEGWDSVGFDPAERAVELAHELAAKAGVKITTYIQGSEDFEWGTEKWDLIVFSYVTLRGNVTQAIQALRPGGYVVVEAFHHDSTKGNSIGGGVVYRNNELLDLFSDLRVITYEDVKAEADFGSRANDVGAETLRVVRLCAMKPMPE